MEPPTSSMTSGLQRTARSGIKSLPTPGAVTQRPPLRESCGKDDLLLLERDGELWAFGGDGETGKGPGAQGNSVWRRRPGGRRVAPC